RYGYLQPANRGGRDYRGVSKLPGRGGAAAGALLGSHDGPGARVPDGGPVVAGGLPGLLHHPAGAIRHHAGRLAAGASASAITEPIGALVPPLLQVQDLKLYYFGFHGTRVVQAVDGVSFSLDAGETLGLVGESGSGKTTTCHAIVRVLPASARIVGGSVALEGEELLAKSPRQMRAIRGRRISTIIQDPMSSLYPLFTIYNQVAEPAYYHRALRGRGLRQRVQELLTAVRIPSPATRMQEFPHQMSGGMRQRIVGAIAQAGSPQIIVADEPTTNLDVTIQLQYLNLLK